MSDVDTVETSDYVVVCQPNLDFIQSLDIDSVQLIVTSPPYNIGKPYEQRVHLDDYLSGQERVIQECLKILQPGGSICWQVGNYVDNGRIVPLDAALFPVFSSLGLVMRNRIVWHYEHGLHCRNRLSGRHETICWWTRDEDYVFNLDPIRVPSKYPNKRYYKGPKKGQLSGNPLGKNPGDVWIFPNVKHNHVEKTSHPCQFPVELPERLVLALSNPGDIVFDPYMGVGSTVIAALKHGRRGFGCDTVPEYVDTAHQRIRDFSAGHLRLRPMGKEIHSADRQPHHSDEQTRQR